MNRTMWLQERGMEEFCDALERFDAKRPSAQSLADRLNTDEHS